MRIRAVILQTGKSSTGIPVPEEVVDALGGRRAPVRVSLANHTYRTSLGAVDGRPMLSLSAENRAAAGVSPGDEVDVEIELDTAPREVTVPADLGAALAGDERARATWDALSYSNKSWHVLQVEGAKTEETRRRRVTKSIAALHEGRPR